MEKFKKNRILIIGGISLILASGISFCLKPKEENKTELPSRDLIAMFVQDESGEYNANPSKEFPKVGYVLNLKKSICKNGGTLSQDTITKKINVKVNHTDQCTLYFDKEIPKIELGDITLAIQDGLPDFERPATTDETANGLFGLQDDYGMSYFFRGTAPNNYVKFGRNANGQDMWWRIIRFNGDGTVRMQYDGVGTAGSNTYTRGFALSNQEWNLKKNDVKYVGWMFGGANGSASTSKEQAQRNETDSEIKTKVEEWYKKNIVDTGYGDFVADVIFCNDRSTPGKSVTGYSSDTGLGYGKKATAFGASARIKAWKNDLENVLPQFTCPQENDKFTVEETSGGNGALTYPVGLITADEILAAGSGTYDSSNNSYYLAKGYLYWSFSPYHYNGGENAYNFTVLGGFNHDTVNSTDNVAPTINLKVEYLSQLRGNGTINNPFHLN